MDQIEVVLGNFSVTRALLLESIIWRATVTDAAADERALGSWTSSSLAPGESLVKRKGSERSRVLLPCLLG